MEQNTVEFTAVLADDEYSVLEGVKTAIDWESLGIRIAALASNGHEALDAIIKYKPDLAIIDIRMPDLTGIQVIERCRNAGISTDFIILSGYDDFSYAKEAMRYGAKAYLLKPLNSTELTKSAVFLWKEPARAVTAPGVCIRSSLILIFSIISLMGKSWNPVLFPGCCAIRSCL